MKELFPEYFFDLINFQHQILFDPKAYVWNALKSLDKYLLSLPLGKIEVKIPAGVHLIDSHLISIGKGSIIEPGAYIKGPCYIGQNCTVRHGAYIRGHLLTGNKCVVGHDSEIKNAILFDGAQAPHFAYVGDTILGNRVNLGAGTICANLKMNKKNILVQIHGEESIDTEMHKLGLIIGDDSQTGCNTVTNPGTFFGKSVWCYPTLNVGGFIPSNSIVKDQSAILIQPRKP